VIELVKVVKGFDGKAVIDGLSLAIPEGKITAIIGLSGEGKSVLLKLLIGLLHPESGRILIDGVLRSTFYVLRSTFYVLRSCTQYNWICPIIRKSVRANDDSPLRS
jgi:ABC-type transporter Mla maintaining outer membrane lipid asymmetry ATPase subunit MlaF